MSSGLAAPPPLPSGVIERLPLLGSSRRSIGDDLGVRLCRGKTGRGVEGLMARLPTLGAGAIATGVAFVPGLAHIRFACQYSFSCSSRCRLAYAAGLRLYCEPIVGMIDNASRYSSLVG